MGPSLLVKYKLVSISANNNKLSIASYYRHSSPRIVKFSKINSSFISSIGRRNGILHWPCLRRESTFNCNSNTNSTSRRSQEPIPTISRPSNATPPKISDSEKALPRETRSTLAQLRSGYSNYLNSYKARISQNQPTPIQDICPHCNDASHTTKHLFNCRGNPTTLNVRDLWSKPLEAARFLNLVRNDDDPG